MSGIYIGSARIGENGKITGGKDGDQKQTTNSNDMVGEVSSQRFYIHSKGWNVLRPILVDHAELIARENKYACDNANIGYNQNERYDVVNQAKKVKSLKDISVKCNSDCSSLTRAEIITACGKDVGDFTTANCKEALLKSGLFHDEGKYYNGMELFNGDILCTCTKGHVVTVNSGNARRKEEKPDKKDNGKYYKKCDVIHNSIVVALKSINVDASFENRLKIAVANGIKNYSGSADQNIKLLNLLKEGKLKRC